MPTRNPRKNIYQPKNPHEVIAIKQWAALRGKTVNTAMKAVSEGKLPEAIRLNGHWYIEAGVPWPLRRVAKSTGEERTPRAFALLQSDYDKLMELARKNNWSAALEIAYLINSEFARLRLKLPENQDIKKE